MQQDLYLPEGFCTAIPENNHSFESSTALYTAWERGERLEGIATMCDENRALHVRFGQEKGISPRKRRASVQMWAH